MTTPVAGALSALARTPAEASRHDLTPRAIVAVSVLALGAIIGLDLIDGELGAIFGVGFVLITATAPMAVRQRGLFTAGVMPPMLMVGAMAFVAVVAPDAIIIEKLPESVGTFGRTLNTTIHHGVILLLGHALAILVVLLRIWATAPEPRRL